MSEVLEMADGIRLMFQRLTLRAKSYGPATAKLSGPSLVGLEKETHAVATDGRVIVWTKRFSEHWDWPAPSEEAKKKLLRFFTPPSLPAAWTGELRALKEFCPEALWFEDCPECRGASAKSEYVSCTFCEGDGNMLPDAVCGYVVGVPLDLQLLANILAPFDGSAMVQLIPEPDEPRLWIIHPDFRIIQQGMTELRLPGGECCEAWQKAERFPCQKEGGAA